MWWLLFLDNEEGAKIFSVIFALIVLGGIIFGIVLYFTQPKNESKNKIEMTNKITYDTISKNDSIIVLKIHNNGK